MREHEIRNRIERDYLGRTTKLCKGKATIPLPLDSPVKEMADWLKLKPLHSFIVPYYRSCWDVVSAHGTHLFNQDSDGDMVPVMDIFLNCGVNVMHPVEPAAGMDPVFPGMRQHT